MCVRHERNTTAVMGMRLAFVPSDRGYSVVAVIGLQQDRNYFLNSDGYWRGNYIPAAYRPYPFVLAEKFNRKVGGGFMNLY